MLKGRCKIQRLLFSILLTGIAFSESLAFATTLLTVSPSADHPQARVMLAGAGFAPNENVDISFDGTAVAVAVANPSGGFSETMATIPATAQPGIHSLGAIGESSGDTAQAQFNVFTSWAENGFDVEGTSANLFENTLSSTNVANLAFAWERIDNPFARPVVGADGLYVVRTSGSTQALSRISADVGHVDWTSQVGVGAYGTPAILGNIVYVGSSDNRIFAFNAITGAQLWASPTGAANETMIASPVIASGLIYGGSTNGSVYALDATTGTVAWQFATASETIISVAVSDGVAYVVSLTQGTSASSTVIYALNATSGEQIWSTQINGSVIEPAVVSDHKIFFGIYDGSYYALRTSDGSQVWSQFPGSDTSGSVFAGGTLFVGTLTTISAVNPSTGTVRWTRTFPFPLHAPVWANGVAYVSNDKALYAIDGISGSRLLSFPYRGAIGGPLVVADGRIYVAGEGVLSALALPSPESHK